MDLDEFTDAMAEDPPGDVMAYHRDRAWRSITDGNRRTNARAAVHLEKVKRLCGDQLGDPVEWGRCLGELREGFRRRPVLLDEVRDL